MGKNQVSVYGLKTTPIHQVLLRSRNASSSDQNEKNSIAEN